MSNFQQLIQQARKMQEKLQKDMADLRVEATAGGGMVSVTMNGSKQLLALRIEKEALDGDIEMLQDLVMAAVNEASRKVDQALGNQLGGLAGALNLGNLGGLL
ncbi:MAG: YbaB/EbfC family nucleoid-associated protein [Acidobacteria bacterium]|nr:YbaB/EbfC family nucleoid-associated protein [Acidobacteriota bacterium]